RSSVPLFGQDRQPMQSLPRLDGLIVVPEVKLRQLELRIMVVEEGGRVMQILGGAARVGFDVELRHAAQQVARKRRERFGHERRPLIVVGIDVGILIGKALVKHVGLGVVRIPTRGIGKYPCQVKLGKEDAFAGSMFESRESNVELSGSQSTHPLLKGRLRGAETRAAGGEGGLKP